MNNQKRHNIVAFIILVILLIGVVFWDFVTGSTQISITKIFAFLAGKISPDDNTLLIIKEFRFPRVIIAILAGAALSVSGLLMQTIFRNPLAGPYILGVSSGAGLGVAILVMSTGLLFPIINTSPPNWLIVTSAAIGAAMVMLIILIASFRIHDIIYVLILGILIGAAVSAIVNMLQFFARDVQVKSFVVWGMGSLYAVSFSDLKIITPIILISILGILFFSKSLNLILLGEDYAYTSGVNIKYLRIAVFCAASVLAGIVTAYCGPLGFIGVAAPHITRWIFRSSNHFVLIPGSALIGALVLLFSDLITHAWLSKGILPINAVTALIGIPFILYIILYSKKTVNIK